MANAGTKNGTTKEDTSDVQMRTSKIRKGIIRKLNTAKYETIDIIVEHEIEAEWSNAEMLMTKSANLTKLVTKDYQDTEDQVKRELALDGYKAFPSDSSDLKRPLEKSDAKQDFDRLK